MGGRRRPVATSLCAWLAVTLVLVAGEVKDDIGPHQVVRLGEVLPDSECRYLLWALDKRLEGKRPSLEEPQLGTGDERPCALRLFEWWEKNKEEASTVVVSSALRDAGRHDLAIELLKNIGQDKILAFDKVVLNYKQNLQKASMKVEDLGITAKGLLRLRREAADRGELVYTVRRPPPGPPHDSFSNRLRPLLHGLACSLLAAVLAAALAAALAGALAGVRASQRSGDDDGGDRRHGNWTRGREGAGDSAAQHERRAGHPEATAPVWAAGRVKPLVCPVHAQPGSHQHHVEGQPCLGTYC